MSLELFNEIWENSPCDGQRLLLQLALAESASKTMGGNTGDVFSSDLVHKARFSCTAELIRALDDMAEHEMLEYTVSCSGERYESISYTLYTYKFDEFDDEEQTKLAELSISGYVYILQSGQYYKIGKTTNITSRLKQLAIQLPHKVELLHTIGTSDPTAAEHFFHEKFNDRRMNGEWFELNSSDITELKAIILWHPKEQQ